MKSATDFIIALILAALFAVVGVLMLTGCSATKAIGNAAREVVALAHEASGELESAVATGEVGERAMPHVERAKQSVDGIAAKGEAIVEVVNSGAVKDADNWFVKLVKGIGWLTVAAILAGICFLVWRFWPYIQLAVGWIPAVFSRKAKTAADFIADPAPVSDADLSSIRAIERAKSDPRFKAALDAELTARGVVT